MSVVEDSIEAVDSALPLSGPARIWGDLGNLYSWIMDGDLRHLDVEKA